MNMPDKREQQLERMREAVDEKNKEAQGRSEEHSIEETGRTQDVQSVRAKNSGHKKKTADKWNQ
jgi:hypothetical protein